MIIPALIQEWRRIAKARKEEADDEFMQGHYYDSEEIAAEVRTLTRCADDLEKALPGWVKCSERMPEYGAVCLCYAPRCYGVEHVIYKNQQSCWVSFRNDNAMWFKEEVTHWMSLPQPPGPV